MSKRKVTLGLDIGIASVGYGLIDSDTGEILEAGVRLFSSTDPANNQTRRGSRQARRLNRRKKHRAERVKQLLETKGFFKGEISAETPYHVRSKALKEKVSKEDLFAALYNIAKRRGISYLQDADVEGMSTDSALGKNIEALKTKFPGQIQMERYETHGKLRGTVTISEEEVYMNIFPTSKYVEEAEAIINKQKEFYPELDTEFLDNYIEILKTKRSYADGPGSEKSRSDYGRWRTNGENWDNIFDILVGKCSMFENERRGSAFSYTAQLYNFLNDMNNLTVAGDKLTTEQKEKILDELMNAKQARIMKIISKIVGCKETDIKGYRIDKDEKPTFHTFEGYRKFNKFITEKGLSIETLMSKREVFDKIADILTLNTEYIKITDGIKKELPSISQEYLDIIADFRKKNTSLFSKWHSLSLKAMLEMENELWTTGQNQMQIATKMGVFKSKVDEFNGLRYIPAQKIVDEIYNPVVSGSVKESVKIVNALLKKYKVIDSIVVEMPRDSNEKEQKDRIKKMQKENEDVKNNATRKAKSEYAFGDEVFSNHHNLSLKIQLWYEQNGMCLYSGKKISIQDLVKNNNMFEVDHIIPKSISFDDSTNNKTLCYSNENSSKGNKTPFSYFKQKSGEWTYEKFEKLVKETKTINSTKRDLLLFEENINKYEVRRKFISRNLNDTRYASRTLLNALQDFMKANYKDTTVSVVRGKLTAKLRRTWRLEKKDRDKDFSHHAVDALVVAAVKHLKMWDKVGNLMQDVQEEKYDEITGELLTPEEPKELTIFKNDEYDDYMYAPPFTKFVDQLKLEVPKSCLYSHKVDKKVNRQVADATIYSTRTGVVKDKEGFKKDSEVKEDYIVGKINNIYDDKSADSFLKRYEKDKTQFLMYHNDPKTFEYIEKIIKSYPESKNPFLEYKNEHGPIKKYSKKNNGPEITSIKYYDKKLGSHLDITKGESNDKKIVLLSLKPWRTDVYYDNLNKKYILVGLKYSHLKYLPNGEGYGVKVEDYIQLLREENITLNKDEILNANASNENIHFCFSLYKNDIVSYNEGNVVYKYRYLSKHSRDQSSEVKPLETATFEKPRTYISFGKKINLCKIDMDVLGYEYMVKQEKLKLKY